MTRTVLHMIGNAHLDPVWLWRWEVGVDEALATFRSAADRCDEYPKFIFTRGEAWLYEQVQRLDPGLFGRVQALVRRGQWHIPGALYVQPDANLPTHPGWARQLTHARAYFERHFGVTPRTLYNVDTFGHPATLPDLLAAHGYRDFVFHRPSAVQMSLPASTFRWRGSGGAEVLAYRIPSPYVTRTDDLYGQIMLALDAADPALGHAMCFYGVGNHGGGPTKANIEYILEHQGAFPGVELRFSTPETFFDAVRASEAELPTVTGDLQFTFPGCYSVMHVVKQAQVRGELWLEQAEAAVRAYAPPEAQAALLGRLDAAWPDLLFTQFHDILSGTAVASAWPSERARQGRARLAAEEVLLDATRLHARTLPAANHQQLVLLNPDRERFQGFVEAEPFLDFDAWGGRWISTPDGAPRAFQLVQPEAGNFLIQRVLLPVTLPPGGTELLLVRDGPAPPAETHSDLSVSETHLQNAYLRADLGPRGVRSLTVDGVNLLGAGGLGLHLRRDSSDTWGFQVTAFTEEVLERMDGASWTVEESGPIRARVRTEVRLGSSRVQVTLSLYRGDPALHLALDVLFAERFRLLQLPIQLARAPAARRDGLAGGCALRPGGETEWPFQGWSQVEVGGRPLALLTRDAYSLRLLDDTWQVTLLRSPRMAWGGGNPDVYTGRDWHTDQGEHHFDFTLHLRPMGEAHLDRLARQAVARPIVFDRYDGMRRPPWGNSPSRRLWTGAEQRARQDGQMLDLPEDGPGGLEEAGDGGSDLR